MDAHFGCLESAASKQAWSMGGFVSAGQHRLLLLWPVHPRAFAVSAPFSVSHYDLQVVDPAPRWAFRADLVSSLHLRWWTGGLGTAFRVNLPDSMLTSLRRLQAVPLISF